MVQIKCDNCKKPIRKNEESELYLAARDCFGNLGSSTIHLCDKCCAKKGIYKLFGWV